MYKSELWIFTIVVLCVFTSAQLNDGKYNGCIYVFTLFEFSINFQTIENIIFNSLKIWMNFKLTCVANRLICYRYLCIK